MKITKTMKQALAAFGIGTAAGMLNPAYAIGLMKGYDIRKMGSRNPGASNVIILEGKKAGAFVMAFDMSKAAAAVKLSRRIFPEFKSAAETAGTASILGHMFSPLMKFRGGKGLACLGGTILAFGLRDFATMLASEIILLGATRYICLVPITASVAYPIYHGITSGNKQGAAILGTAALPIFLKHRENLERIKQDREFKVDFLWNRDAELQRTGWAAEV